MIRATFSALRPPNQSAMSQPAHVSRLPVSGSVDPRPSTLSHTTHFAMKIANAQHAIALLDGELTRGEIGRDPLRRVAGGELGLVALEQIVQDRPRKEAGQPFEQRSEPHDQLAGFSIATTFGTPASSFCRMTCGGFSVILRSRSNSQAISTMPSGIDQVGSFAVSDVQSWPLTSGSSSS